MSRPGDADRFAAWLRAGTPDTSDQSNRVLDAFAYAARAAERTGAAAETVACRRGCDHCCHLPVAVTRAEARVFARALQGMTTPVALARIRAAASAAAHAYPGEDRAPGHGLRVPCPALLDGACAAYAARPLACRAWNSVDAQACADALHDPSGAWPVPARTRLRAVHATVAEALARRLGGWVYLAPTLARLLAGDPSSRRPS